MKLRKFMFIQLAAALVRVFIIAARLKADIPNRLSFPPQVFENLIIEVKVAEHHHCECNDAVCA